jgi:hypothetical protein
MSLVACASSKYYIGVKMERYKVGTIVHRGATRNFIHLLIEEPESWDHLGGIHMNGRAIIK